MIALRRSAGFTLIEVMAALLIFTVITLGIMPLVAGSLKSAAVGRSYTIGKNLVTESMERVRGLPYFESIKGATAPFTRRDILDLYYPDLGAGYDAGTLTFVTTCTSTAASPSVSGPLACPPDNVDGTTRIPDGYTLTFRATFVTALAGTDPQQFNPVAPDPSYSWTDETTEAAPGLMRMVVRADWNYGGQAKAFQLDTLIANRKLSPDKLRANATINFGVEAVTGYDNAGVNGALKALIGNVVSSAEVRAFAAADQNASAAELLLTENPVAEGDDGEILQQVFGAEASISAPPNQMPTFQVNAAGQIVVGPGPVGSFDASTVESGTATPDGVQVVSELPRAVGDFRISSGTGLILDNTRTAGNPLQLLPDVVVRVSGVSFGEASAFATALQPQASRQVNGTAHLEIAEISLYPTSFAPLGVVRVTGFEADISCVSNGVTATPTGTWSAQLRYWRDGSNDGIPNGAYVTVGPGSFFGEIGGAGGDPLAAIKAGPNPLVYDGINPLDDVRLFADPVGGTPGYINSWTSLRDIPSEIEGVSASVTMAQAISIGGVPTDDAVSNTAFSVRIGSMSCQGVDSRA